MTFIDRLENLCKENGIDITNLGNFITVNGSPISKSAVSGWRSGAVPRNVTIKAIADYFKVSVGYLTGDDSVKERNETNCLTCQCRENCQCQLSPQEHEIIRMFRTASEIGKMRMIQQIVTVWEQDASK